MMWFIEFEMATNKNFSDAKLPWMTVKGSCSSGAVKAECPPGEEQKGLSKICADLELDWLNKSMWL